MGVKVITEGFVTEIGARTATIACNWTDDVTMLEADSTVLVTQRHSDNALYQALRSDKARLANSNISAVYGIGDCLMPEFRCGGGFQRSSARARNRQPESGKPTPIHPRASHSERKRRRLQVGRRFAQRNVLIKVSHHVTEFKGVGHDRHRLQKCPVLDPSETTDTPRVPRSWRLASGVGPEVPWRPSRSGSEIRSDPISRARTAKLISQSVEERDVFAMCGKAFKLRSTAYRSGHHESN